MLAFSLLIRFSSSSRERAASLRVCKVGGVRFQRISPFSVFLFKGFVGQQKQALQ